jgi:hypothetical protein
VEKCAGTGKRKPFYVEGKGCGNSSIVISRFENLAKLADAGKPGMTLRDKR